MTALCPGPVATEFVEAGGFKTREPGPVVRLVDRGGRRAGPASRAPTKGKRVVIPGIGNRFRRRFGRHGPRSVMLGPVASAYRRTIGE